MQVASRHSERLDEMIRSQIQDRGITDPRLIDALRQVPRELFFSGHSRRDAFADRATPIAYGQTISQPYVVALMTERLAVGSSHSVLELGTGSGYQTAVLCHLAREVFTIERIKPLLDVAFERVLSLGHRNVKFHWGDGRLGWPDGRQFDRVMLTCAAETMPEDLLRRCLAEGGSAVLPVGPADAQMMVHVRREGSVLHRREICQVRFVPLISGV